MAPPVPAPPQDSMSEVAKRDRVQGLVAWSCPILPMTTRLSVATPTTDLSNHTTERLICPNHRERAKHSLEFGAIAFGIATLTARTRNKSDAPSWGDAARPRHLPWASLPSRDHLLIKCNVHAPMPEPVGQRDRRTVT